jgi:hypothetical protein
MEASVDPLFRGPDWKPITPKRGSFLHADSQCRLSACSMLSSEEATLVGGSLCSPNIEPTEGDIQLRGRDRLA